jgi:hypothetical protein
MSFLGALAIHSPLVLRLCLHGICRIKGRSIHSGKASLMIATFAIDQPLIVEELTVPQIVQGRLSRGVSFLSFLCLSFFFLLIKREPFCSIELTPYKKVVQAVMTFIYLSIVIFFVSLWCKKLCFFAQVHDLRHKRLAFHSFKVDCS